VCEKNEYFNIGRYIIFGSNSRNNYASLSRR